MINYRQIIKHPEFKRLFVLRTAGNFLILFSLFIIIKTFWQPVSEEFKYYKNRLLGKRYLVATEQQAKINKKNSGQKNGLFSNLLKQKSVEVLVPKDNNFSIIIPKIGANAKIIDNVDPANEKDYQEKLKQGVAHAHNSVYPGQNGMIYLFAHSSDYFYNVGTYNAVFYLIYKLNQGDEISLIYKGIRYKYLVTEKMIVNPKDVEFITRQTDFEYLTLQTCWPLGTAFKRLLVFAVPARSL